MRTAMLVVATLLVFTGTPAWAQDPVDIGSRLEPMVDNFLIDILQETRLTMHAPRAAENVLDFNESWEGLHCGYVTVFQDGDLYRMYYRGMPTPKDGSEVECTCYAESPDGIHWTKPKLGLFEMGGTRDNNVILHGMAPLSHNFAPFLDTRPDVPAEARYKALAGTSDTGLIAFASPDGIHWSKLQEAAVITQGAFDSQNVAFWSETEKKYLCYFRTWSEGGYKGIRTVSRTTSDDFIHWAEPASIDFGGTPLEHLYTNQTQPYYRAPHVYVAIAARFMPGRRVVSAEQTATLGGAADYSGDCSDTVLMTSRGGNRYDRTFMEAFVRPGVGVGNWTSRTNYPAWGIVPTGEHEMSFYVQRNYGQTAHHLERQVLRIDGFASINAPYAGGEMTTKPLRFSGKELVINYATSAAGSVWVELQDAAGKPLAGFAREDCNEIIGDEIERKVTWKNQSDLSAIAGQTVRLRFVMKDADLYSLRFR